MSYHSQDRLGSSHRGLRQVLEDRNGLANGILSRTIGLRGPTSNHNDMRQLHLLAGTFQRYLGAPVIWQNNVCTHATWSAIYASAHPGDRR